MGKWLIGLLLATLATALLGFSGAFAAGAEPARVVFFILLLLFVVSAGVAIAGSHRQPHMR